MSEKTFEATPSRLARAKREGDVALSQELTATMSFAAALCACSLVLPKLVAALRQALMSAASGSHDAAALAHVGLFTLIPLVAGALATIVSAAVQAGGFALTPLRVSFERCNPTTNLARMFSRESLITIARAFAALAFACFAMACIRLAPSDNLPHAAWNAALRTAWLVCFVGAVFGVADYALQVARRRKRLRMTADEFRRDQREHEGDPLARARRRAAHRAIARASLQRVREAAFVVTNPTHVAMALAYDPPNVPVPTVLVRAADDVAQAVRTIATEHGIPLVENVLLARALYARCKAGDVIPQELYVGVAEVVASLVRSGVLA